MKSPLKFCVLAYLVIRHSGFVISAVAADAPDLIVHHAKIISVDDHFSIQEAMSIRDGRIIAIGPNDDILKSKTDQTRLLDRC